MKLDLNKLIKKHDGKWVALNEDSSKVVASDEKAEKVYKKAKDKGSEIPKIYKVPEKYVPYIG